MPREHSERRLPSHPHPPNPTPLSPPTASVPPQMHKYLDGDSGTNASSGSASSFLILAKTPFLSSFFVIPLTFPLHPLIIHPFHLSQRRTVSLSLPPPHFKISTSRVPYKSGASLADVAAASLIRNPLFVHVQAEVRKKEKLNK